eukprot:scaffold627203_cov27-Prasinocladus_malaysianus.AAC.1
MAKWFSFDIQKSVSSKQLATMYVYMQHMPCNCCNNFQHVRPVELSFAGLKENSGSEAPQRAKCILCKTNAT